MRNLNILGLKKGIGARIEGRNFIHFCNFAMLVLDIYEYTSIEKTTTLFVI